MDDSCAPLRLASLSLLALTVGSAACATSEDEIADSGFKNGSSSSATGGTTVATGGLGPTGGLSSATGGLSPSGGDGSGGITPVTCAEGQTQCGAVCVELGTNEHCSGCDDACPVGSTCSAPSDDGGTPECVCEVAGTTACSNGCFDLLTSIEHCGACENACGAGASCEAGGCVCPVDTQVCEGFDGCVDILASDEHCGATCVVCAAPSSCQAGVCECPVDDVVMLCGEVCTDTSADVSNCGACDVVCGTGELCRVGECTLDLAIVEPNAFIDIPTGGVFGILINIESWHNENSKDSGTLQCQIDSGSGTIAVDVGGVTDEMTFSSNGTTESLAGIPSYQASGTLDVPDTLVGLRCQVYW